MRHEPTSRRASPEIRRAQILDAAQACFSREGYHRSTMDDVVRAAGLSKGSLYWHFDSKEKILLGIFERYAEELFASWQATADSGVEPVESMLRAGEIFMERMLDESELARTWLVFLEHPVARDRMAEIYQRSRDQLVEQLGRRPVPLSSEQAEALAAGLTALAEGLFLQYIVDSTFDPIAPFRTTARALLKGITR